MWVSEEREEGEVWRKVFGTNVSVFFFPPVFTREEREVAVPCCQITLAPGWRTLI